jgi:UDP-glucose 4-epimerase
MNPSTPAALVTGGAGFIGSHLSRRLLAEGWHVDVVDNLTTGFRENIPAGTNFFEIDVSRNHLPELLPARRYDAVFHLAAQSSGEISFDNPSYDLRTNCQSTLLLLEWCKTHGTARFLYTSSMSIYGDQEAQPVTERAAPVPKSFYGVGKLASEAYLKIYEPLGIRSTALRLFNVYGPGQNLSNMRQGMVSIFLAYILNNQKVVVKGSPERYRDLVYIDDVIDAYMACLANPSTYGKAYNVATGEKTTVGGLIDAELKAFGHKPGSYPVHFADGTPGDTFGIVGDIGSLCADTGWKPQVTLAVGLERMVAWARTLPATRSA